MVELYYVEFLIEDENCKFHVMFERERLLGIVEIPEACGTEIIVKGKKGLFGRTKKIRLFTQEPYEQVKYRLINGMKAKKTGSDAGRVLRFVDDDK